MRHATAHGALPAGAMLGRYELLGLLSVGGMAEIYLARTAGLAGFEKLLVVKRMLPHLAQQRHYVEMFLAEARLGAILDHPNVVSVSDIGEDTGNYYYAMEYVRGADLRRIMKAAVEDHGRLPIHCAVAIGIGMSAGLDHAHGLVDHQGQAVGVVHRDVTLSNVLVSYDGTVKVTDFGVAKVSASERTRAGTLKGKIGYMSPEQCRGEVVDRRSDVFSAGIILYELTTGRRLFKPRQSEFEILQRIVREDVEPPSVREPDYPLPLEEIVMRALHRDRDQRYQTARELQRDLEALAQTARLAATPTDLGEYVRAIVPPPPATVLPAPRAAPPRPPTVEPDPWDADDDPPPTDLPNGAMTAGPTSTPARSRAWSRLGLVAIVVVLVGVGAAVVTQQRQQPQPEPSRIGRQDAEGAKEQEPRQEPRVIAQVPAPVQASEPVPVPVAVPVPDPEPTRHRTPPPAPAPARRSAREYRHSPSRSEVSHDAGPSLFDDPLPPPVDPPQADLFDARPAAADPPPSSTADPPRTTEPVHPKPKPVAPKPAPKPAKSDPGSFDAEPSLSSVDVDGPLGDSEIRRAVKRVLPAFRACYQAAATHAGKTPATKAKVKFSIDETRAAQDVQASGGSLPGLDTCLEEAASRIKTRIAPDVGDARVTVGVSFAPTDP